MMPKEKKKKREKIESHGVFDAARLHCFSVIGVACGYSSIKAEQKQKNQSRGSPMRG